MHIVMIHQRLTLQTHLITHVDHRTLGWGPAGHLPENKVSVFIVKR